MASQSPMGITGRIGNFIHYKMGDKYYVRSAPRKFKQTKAMKVRAGEFGRASSLGRVIREVLLPVIPNPSDNNMQTRLVSTLFEMLQSDKGQRAEAVINPKFIRGFEFVKPGTGIQGRWKLPWEVVIPSPGLVQIRIPSFVPKRSIGAPAQTVSVICRIAVGVCNVATAMTIGRFSTELNIDYSNDPVDAQTISFNLASANGSLIVTGVSLEYKILKDGRIKTNTNKNFMPAGIVHAIWL